MDKTSPAKPPITITERILAIMATYRPGEVWQCCEPQPNPRDRDWVDCFYSEPAWDWSRFDYRKKPEPERPTKPEPTHRPYDTEEVPFGVLVRIKESPNDMGLVTSLVAVSTSLTPHIIVIGLGTFTLAEAFEKLEYTYGLVAGRDCPERVWYPFGKSLAHDTKPPKPTANY